jgi:hypothetical protein
MKRPRCEFIDNSTRWIVSERPLRGKKCEQSTREGRRNYGPDKNLCSSAPLYFGSAAPRPAFEEIAVVEQAVGHGVMDDGFIVLKKEP